MDFLTRTIKFPASIDDGSIAQFHHQTELALQADADVVLIDFSRVEFTSSPGLMALVMSYKRVREANKRLFLCSVSEQVRMLLELTGMNEVFEVLPRSEETDSPAIALAA
ncbi:anti-sigma factor antagonist [Phormidesmis priestleyi ULC007]|uniref:Anti-sigma factor antagonist n=1 Tax=Phormidesmis priestleyi ULC007 TaxID=1920490 RepID=A0A2T1DNP9_9CYAN|nr:STAS domain-containing protein [Phormidesmis priestleyi]PSB22116.1 anti-sigma factor antagonist [Phormidesmis priestleyi ULC007]PZO54916.1 MAG: anti-sigma factor antagonist [Phormidesmis priestleyi]